MTSLDMALDEEELSKRKQKAKDMSDLADQKIPEAKSLAKAGNLNGAIEVLLSAEKQTRQGGDVSSTSRLCVEIINLCFEKKEYKLLNENLVLISKRRGQLKTAVQRTVQAAMEFIPKLEGDTKLALIDTLISITEGKIYVEAERARLTRILADIKEAAGDVAGACETMRAVAVETFGAMDKIEKTDFILEQVRLCLDTADPIRAQILSNKINRKFLNGDDVQELKLRFYKLMARFYRNDENYLEIARCYQAIYNTPIVEKDDEKRTEALKNLAVYSVLAPHDAEQTDLLERVRADSTLDELPAYKALVDFFGAVELMRWPSVEKLYKDELASMEGFGKDGKLWGVLHQRVVEHNIRIVAKYYGRIELKRLSTLLDLNDDDTEKHVCELVTNKSIYARIDRPHGIINFVAPKSPNDLMNEWSTSIDTLLTLVGSTCHLIANERMVHESAK